MPVTIAQGLPVGADISFMDSLRGAGQRKGHLGFDTHKHKKLTKAEFRVLSENQAECRVAQVTLNQLITEGTLKQHVAHMPL